MAAAENRSVYAPNHHLLAFAQAQRGEVDVLQELGNGHEVYETVALLASSGPLTPEALSE